MAQPYRFGLIGCGRIGQRHAQILNSGSIKNAELASVCDTSLERLDKFKLQFSVPGFSDMKKMLSEVELDFVVVCTESGNHENHVIDCAQFGVDIVVEKPMALTVTGAQKMINECKKYNVNLHVVKQNRFNLPIIKTKQAYDEGKFGNITLGTVRVRWKRDQAYYQQDKWRGTWSLDGGVLANQASHHIDILHYFMGDVESVYAYANTSLVDIETEDTAVAVLKFKSGALGIIEATTATRPVDLEGSLSILGEYGSVVIGGFALNRIDTWKFAEEKQLQGEDLNAFSENPPDVYGFGHAKYYENLVKFKNGEGGLVISGESGLKSVEIMSALYKSIETRKEIFLPLDSAPLKLGKS